MSPPVMTLPARNFKFLKKDHLKEREIIDVAEKNFRGLPSETSSGWGNVSAGRRLAK